MKKRLFWQIFPTYLVIAILALVAFSVNVSFLVERFFINQTRYTLEARAQLTVKLLEKSVNQMDLDFIDQVCKNIGKDSQTRITIIESSGRVLGESDTNPASMENHLNRPEVQQVLNGKSIGSDIRLSATLKQRMMYVAVPLKENQQVIAIIRTAFPLNEIEKTINSVTSQVIQYSLIITAFLILASLYFSWRLSRPLVLLRQGAERFAQGELDYKLNVEGTAEVEELAKTMNAMAGELDRRIQTAIRHQNEQQAILSAMLEGVIAFDTNGICLSLNMAAAKILQIDLGKSAGRRLEELVHNNELLQFIQNSLQLTEPAEKFILALGANQQEIYLQVRISALLNEQGIHMGALIVLNDITRIHRLEEIRKDFVANVSHELKTPVTSIQGFIETLQDGAIDSPDDARRFLDIIARQTEKLSLIIEDLLLLCELEQKGERVSVPLAMSNIRQIILSAIEVCKHKSEKSNIHINIECPANLESPVNGSLLEQAILNLTDNAIKYSGEGSDVNIIASVQDDTLIIRVQDFGCGIAPEHQARIFERFYRVDKARSKKLGGTGLGLSIVKHIAQTHRGSISLESQLGKGSLFTIRIPIEKEFQSE